MMKLPMLKAKLNNIRALTGGRELPGKGALLRVAVGACAGIVLILVVTALYRAFSEERKPLDATQWDQENITLPAIAAATEETPPSGDNPAPPEDRIFSRFEANRKTVTPQQLAAIQNDRPRFTLVIQMIGRNDALTRMATEKLSDNVTFSLTPYLSEHNEIAGELRNKGFEIWMLMATETLERHTDNGPYALSPTHNLDNNMGALEQQLKDKNHITGISFAEKSLMPSADLLWPPIIRDLFAEGYAVHDATDISVSPDVYSFDGRVAPYIKAGTRLDLDVSQETVEDRLEILKSQILARGNMVVTTTLPYPAILDILAEWINSLEAEGITLIPLSAQTLN